jgi:hypothetical protein
MTLLHGPPIPYLAEAISDGVTPAPAPDFR